MSEKRYNTLKEVHADGITDRDKIRAVYAPTYTQLSGLRKLAVYSSKMYNKTFVLMGESHTLENKCYADDKKHPDHIVVTDFIKEIIQCHDGVVIKDFYLETEYNPELTSKFYDYANRERSNSFIHINASNLNRLGCLRKSEKDTLKDCPYPGSRFHSCDIRGTIFNSGSKFKNGNKCILYPLHNLIAIYHLVRFYSKGNMKDVTNYYHYLNTLHIPKYDNIDSFIEDLYRDLERLKINKQLSKIDDPLIVKTIRDFMDKNIDMLKNMRYDDINIHKVYIDIFLLSSYNVRLDSVSNIDKIGDSNLRNKILTTAARLSHIKNQANIHASIMDGYTLGRVFRTFKGGIKPKNIIMHTGDMHTNHYMSVLEQLGFTREFHRDTYKNPSDKGMCIDMTGFRVEWLL